MLNWLSTQCHWPRKWGWFIRPWMLISQCTITVFSYPKILKSATLLYQGLHSLLIKLPCFSLKQNAVLIYQKCYHERINGLKRICRKDHLQIIQKSSLWKLYNVHSKRICSTDSLQAAQLWHSCDPPFLSGLPNSSNNQWVPKRNFNKHSRKCSLYIFQILFKPNLTFQFPMNS